MDRSLSLILTGKLIVPTSTRVAQKEISPSVNRIFDSRTECPKRGIHEAPMDGCNQIVIGDSM